MSENDTRWSNRMKEQTAAIAANVRCIDRRNNTTIINNFLNQTCIAGLVKTLVWTHHKVNSICAKSFCPQKTIKRTLFLAGRFLWQRNLMFINDVTVTYQNKIHTSYSQLSYLQNVYFKTITFRKLNRIMPFCNLFTQRLAYYRPGNERAAMIVGLCQGRKTALRTLVV